MKATTITVTEAARNFADCVNRAHYQNMTFVLLKGGKPFAQIVPEKEKRCSGRVLREALSKADLTVAEAREWHREMRAFRKNQVNPIKKWQ